MYFQIPDQPQTAMVTPLPINNLHGVRLRYAFRTFKAAHLLFVALRLRYQWHIHGGDVVMRNAALLSNGAGEAT